MITHASVVPSKTAPPFASTLEAPYFSFLAATLLSMIGTASVADGLDGELRMSFFAQSLTGSSLPRSTEGVMPSSDTRTVE